jgi:hypothetical protein
MVALPIADFQLPIYLRAQPAKKSAIGNWHPAMEANTPKYV